MEGKMMKVIYYGKIWESNTWINKSTFEGYKESYPHQKMLISQNGTTLNVEIGHISLAPEDKKTHVQI